jgi:hypothetical protein
MQELSTDSDVEMRCANTPYDTTSTVVAVTKRETTATPISWADVVKKEPASAHAGKRTTDVSTKRGSQASQIVLRSLSKNNHVKLNIV